MAPRGDIDWVRRRRRYQHYLPDIYDLTSSELGRQLLRKICLD
jgi:hypothetical protein